MKKTILITGGAGFIAHHLVDTLLRVTDWNIVALDRLDYSGNLNRLNEVISNYPASTQKRVKIIFHDLKAEVNSQIRKMIGNVNYIAHLAAGSHVDRSILDPMGFVLDNVIGTTNILEYARVLDTLERFIYFSTDEVFGPAPLGVKFKENDRYNALNPYSASKAAAEELVVAYENTYSLPVFITHTMNVFGERQHPEKFIPLAIKKIMLGEKLGIHSSKDFKSIGSRVYVHARDVSEALLFLINYPTNELPTCSDGTIKCHKFNIVGSREINNLELAQMIADIQKKPLNYELVDFHSTRPGHDLRYSLDGGKMAAMGWIPSDIERQLPDVVSWSINNDRWLL